ncbi:MAG: hypothetical protein WAL87_03660 [Chthoniobacterales bacterium]|jgi:hypothetical protein
MTKPTTVAVTLDPESYTLFKEAVALTESAGAKVSVGQLVQHHLHDEIRKQNPRKIAQRFLKSVVRQINVTPRGETAGRQT